MYKINMKPKNSAKNIDLLQWYNRSSYLVNVIDRIKRC